MKESERSAGNCHCHCYRSNVKIRVIARRFLCRQRLGYRADKNAEYLMPVPSESVVYGSGETAVVLSKVRTAFDVITTACSMLQACVGRLLLVYNSHMTEASQIKLHIGKT